MGYAKAVNYNAGSRWGVYPSGKVHRALDFPCPVGTRVQAGMSGTVTTAGWSDTGFGNHVRVKYDDGNTAIYGHLSKIQVRVGQRVAKRQQIGLSGNTGNSTGPHLHWEVRRSSWDPATSWNFTSSIEPYAASTAVTSFDISDLKYKANNATVKKYQAWLWSKTPSTLKVWFRANVYDFDKHGFTTFYGDSTARLTQETYKSLDKQYPNGGWDSGVKAGVWPREPGPGLFKHFGASTY